MNRIASATCPRCGAELRPVPGQEQVTCQYCGTTSFVQRPQPVSAGFNVPRKSNLTALFVVLGVVALVTAGVGVAVLALVPAGPSETRAPSPPQLATPVAPIVVEPPAVHAVVPKPDNGIGAKLRSNFTPLLTDVDGDGNADVVVAIETSTQRSKHFAVLSGRDGHELARTAALLDGEDDVLAAVLGRRLLTASRKGQLSSYGLGDGSKQWTTALGARASTFCNPKGDESFVVVTDDQRQLAIDLTTGQQTATKARCSAPLTRPERGDDPRDRHDYDAPFGTESYHCGGVTVMGSENYTVADQCRVRAHVDTDRLDGLVGHRLWKFDRNWLVFGVRKPGAYVPMLGLLSNGKLVWKQSVPLDNPLEAREGSPQHVGLSQGLVIAAYALEKDRSQWLTAFAVADGARRWNVALPQNIQTISNLVSSPSRVFIQASEQLILLDATSGKQLAVVGDTK